MSHDAKSAKERKAIRMAAREGDMMLTSSEPLRAMLGVVDRQRLRAQEGDTPSTWGVALPGYFI